MTARRATPASLAGKRVLLLGLSRIAPENAYLTLGIGRVVARHLEVVPEHGQEAVSVSERDLRYNVFASATLPKLVTDAYVLMARRLAAQADRCIALLMDHPPRGAKCMSDFIGGLALGRQGQIYLMRVR